MTHPLSRIIESVDASTRFLDAVEKSARRVRRRDRFQFAAFLTGTLIATAVTARFIELGEPWWMITFGVVMTAAWAEPAAKCRRHLRNAAELLAEVRVARLNAADLDLQQFLRFMMNVDLPLPDDAGETPAPAPKPEGATS